MMKPRRKKAVVFGYAVSGTWKGKPDIALSTIEYQRNHSSAHLPSITYPDKRVVRVRISEEK